MPALLVALHFVGRCAVVCCLAESATDHQGLQPSCFRVQLMPRPSACSTRPRRYKVLLGGHTQCAAKLIDWQGHPDAAELFVQVVH